MSTNRKSPDDLEFKTEEAASPEPMTEVVGTLAAAALGASGIAAVRRLISAGREREASELLLKEFLRNAAGSRREDLHTGSEGLFKGGRTAQKIPLRNLDLKNVKVTTSGGKNFGIEWELEGEFEGKLSEVEKVISAEARKLVTFDRKLEGA